MLWGINILLQVIRVAKEKGSHSHIFEEVEWNLLGLKIILESGGEYYREIV
jgi:hypothetical protein